MTENAKEQSPFTRPGFVAAAIVIALIALLGLGVVVMNMRDQTPSTATSVVPTAPQTSAVPSAAPSTAPKEPSGEASVCGLTGEVLEGKLSEGPLAEWEYQGTTAYPTSTEFGPAETNSNGVRYCFQHSPEGALFAAANAVVQGSDGGLVGPWLHYFVADGPHREAVLAQGAGPGGRGQGVRVEIEGFRLLEYDGKNARVDIVVRGTSGGRTLNLSMVYSLVWQGGDWKLSVDNPKSPINVAQIPDLAGYISWKA